MPSPANPFLERRSDQTISDQEFVRLFSPKILDRLPDNIFDAGVHVLHSPPGGGKTTLLRALTPGALRGFWARKAKGSMDETIERMQARSIIDREEGPKLLGIMLSCAAGYADLPPGANLASGGVFRALMDCRIVQRTLRGLLELLGYEQTEYLNEISLDYPGVSGELKGIPRLPNAADLLAWAEKAERQIYAKLDAFAISADAELPRHVRLEGVLWLQSVRFTRKDLELAPRRLLMVDDLHKLRDPQRMMLKEEITEMRPTIPVWLAQRTIAMGAMLLSPGARDGRDVSQHSLDELWSSSRNQFLAFAKSVLDRRMADQESIDSESLEVHLKDHVDDEEVVEPLQQGIQLFLRFAEPFRKDQQYDEWLARADQLAQRPTVENVIELFKLRIQIARNERRKQLRLDLTPLPADELATRDTSKEQNAAEIFLHEDVGVPYYFGIERVSAMATNNVDELLYLAGALYDGLKTKRVLRHRQPVLSAREQEKYLREAARRKLDFVPKSHTQGTRAQRLLTGVGEFCRDRTFEINAPYAPGVTGFKISDAEYGRLESGSTPYGDEGRILVRVLFECVAENLLVQQPTAATTNRDSGFVYYLNRTLCTNFGLPLQYGGWQEIDVRELITWMQRGPTSIRRRRLFE